MTLQGKRFILLAAVSASIISHRYLLRALVLHGLSPLRLSQQEHSAPKILSKAISETVLYHAKYMTDIDNSLFTFT